MTITVFGASGSVGRLVVERLLRDGHSVVLFVHSSSPVDPSDRVKIIKSDVHNPAFVEAAVRGSNAVISTLGSWHTPTKDILSTAMRFAIPAMQQEGIKRLITLTGSGAWAPNDDISLGNKLQHRLFTTVAKNILRDAENHLQQLAESGLDWTCLRAPVMSNKPESTYVLNADLPKLWETIPRATVAKAIVDQLADSRFKQLAPHLHAA